MSPLFLSENWGTMNFRHVPILMAFLQLLLVNPLAAAERPGQTEAETFMQWSSYSVERLADGQVRLILTLESSRPELHLDNPTAFYRLAKPARWDEPAAPGEGEIYALDWERPDELKLVLLSGEFGRATVFARAEIEGRLHYAQTAFNLYGRSRAGARPEPLSLSLPQTPGWPEFSISSEAPLYWPQTGQEFTLKLKGDSIAKNLVVWDGPRRAAELEPVETGFKYWPEHDPGLDRAGPRASKPLVFVAPINGGGSVSFTLFVHRSRRAGLNMPAGLGVFAAGFLATGIPVCLTRRRFRICA